MSRFSLFRFSAAAMLAAAALAACSTSADQRISGLLKPTNDPSHSSAPAPAHVVISQVYGGGGNAGATYKNDFVELFNSGGTAQSLVGWSVQYASSAGITWQVTNLTGTIQPGQYFLVQEAPGAGGSTSLPTPDVVGTIPMSATAGKIALSTSTTALSGACQTSAADFVPYGTAVIASCTATIAPALSNTTADIRGSAGCAITGDNSADFTTVNPPNPRNTSTPTSPCTPIAAGPLDHVALTGPSTLNVGSTVALTATPQDASNVTVATATVTWSTSDASIATVDASGNVTGVAANATPVVITVTATDGAIVKTNTLSITVSIAFGPLDHVTITGATTVSAGGSITLTATPQDAANKTVTSATVTWTTSDASIATVDATGKVTGVAANATPAVITATATNAGITKAATQSVTVTIPAIGYVALSSSSSTFPPGFQTQVFATAQVSSGGAVIPATFVFEALDPGIATIANVQNTGIITGVSASATKPRFKVTATPTAGGTPYSFTASTLVTIETPVSAPTSIYATNDEFGDPSPATASNPNDFLIVRPQYTISYNQSRGTPNWVSYELDSRDLVIGADRCNCFTADPLLPGEKQIFTSDYTSGGFDRGHMTRSADRTAANVDNATTFYLTNVVPQQADLNQGVWATFENMLADSAQAGRAVYIITGPLFSKSHGLSFLKGEGKVAIPDSTWKIALIGPRVDGVPFTHGGIHTLSDMTGISVLAVNMPNIAGVRGDAPSKYFTTIGQIEQATGLNFLSALDESIQCKVEVRDCLPVSHIVSATGSSTVAAGSPFVLNIGATDADGAADGPWKLSIGWGDATTYGATLFALPTDARPLGRGKTWSVPGTYTVKVTITDKKGGAAVSTLVVTVTP
ncbi:MAG: DNA/RNA non-specific endonuclease [Gemmatimonadaceae bacterium]